MTRRRGRYGADPEERRLVRVEIRLPWAMYQRLLLALALNGERQTEWLRRKLAEAVDRALALVLGYCDALRPNGAIYQRAAGGVYTMVARGTGGERLWLVATVNDMPRACDAQGIGFLCYITPQEDGGFDSGKDLFVVAAQDMVRDSEKRARGER